MKKYIGNFYKRYTWQIQFLFISLLLFGQYILHPTIITHNDTEYFLLSFLQILMKTYQNIFLYTTDH